MATNIGNVDAEQLEKNVQKIVASIQDGSMSLVYAVDNRLREIDNLRRMKQTVGNVTRQEYVWRELQRLLEVLGA